MHFPLPGDKDSEAVFPGVGELKRLFAEFQPHVVVIATPGVYGITGARLARKSGIPYLTGMHTSFEQLTELYWPKSIRGKFVRKSSTGRMRIFLDILTRCSSTQIR